MINKHLLYLLIAFLSACNAQEPLKTGKEGKALPDFKIQVDSGSTFNTNQIPVGKSSVFLAFRTDCPYCRAEIEDILDDIDNLDNCNFYFVSKDTLPEIKKFIKQHLLTNFSNITVGHDTEYFFNKYFKSEGVPFTVIYNKDRKLSAAFFGKIGPKEIKKYSN